LEYLFEEGEREVDVLGLVEDGALDLGLVDAFGAGEVDEVQLAHEADLLVELVALERDGEDAVRARGGLVQRRGADLADEVAHHEQIQALLLVADVHHVDVLEADVVDVVLLEHHDLHTGRTLFHCSSGSSRCFLSSKS